MCPVNKADVVNNDFLAILTMADASSVAWSTHSSFDRYVNITITINRHYH